MSEYAIELRNICKTFGTVKANSGINLNLRHGEILALFGENGSGKTTLMNMLSGIYKPDEGKILIDGREVTINSPEDSKRLGIGMVHQHFKLIDNFTAADNIWIGRENQKDDSISDRFLLTDRRFAKIKKICRKFGFEVDPRKKVSQMAVSEKQTLEIVKVLYYGARILILDEPTAVLTVQEIDKLFKVLRRLKNEGHSIIIITHKLNEVSEISDRIAILRKGEYIGTVNTAETTERELTEMMVGYKVELNINRTKVEKAEPLLEIRDLVVKNDEGAVAVDKINFYIRGGEMLGVAGIAGCGQKELCEAIAGLRSIESGMIIHKGESIIGKTPKQIIEHGVSMSFIPEDRLGMGLSPSLSITDNMILKSYNDTPGPFVDRTKGRALAEHIIDALEIATPSTECPVRRLSGGNVQKVLIGREISSKPNVLVTAYSVRGLDINASFMVYNILNSQKAEGVGILFVGEDLDVMMSLCDKIMVICHGRLMGVVNADNTTKEQIGLMMTGSLDLTDVHGKRAGIARDTKIPSEMLADSQKKWSDGSNE